MNDAVVARYSLATFTTAGSWSTFDTTTVDANAADFADAAFDRRYVRRRVGDPGPCPSSRGGARLALDDSSEYEGHEPPRIAAVLPVGCPEPVDQHLLLNPDTVGVSDGQETGDRDNRQ